MPLDSSPSVQQTIEDRGRLALEKRAIREPLNRYSARSAEGLQTASKTRVGCQVSVAGPGGRFTSPRTTKLAPEF